MKNLKTKISVLLLLSLAVFTGLARAQDANDETPIKVETLLLNIPLTVADKNGRNVPGLKKEDFSIYQDGEKQEIAFFVADEAPMNVAILIDTSPSTAYVLDSIQKTAKDFIKVFRPEDRGVVVTFDYETLFLSELTADRKKLSKAIDKAAIARGAGSDMNSAIYNIVKNHFAEVKGRKAIIALTDGMVYGRGITNKQILKLLQMSDTLFYPIIFSTPAFSTRQAATRNNINLTALPPLKLLAEETAGRYYEKDAANLKEAFQSIAEELKKQYLVGYYPSKTGKPDTIRIVVDRPDVTIQAKRKLMFGKGN